MSRGTEPVTASERGPQLRPRRRSLAERARASEGLRLAGLTLYYLGIIVALIVLYGGSHYTAPPFIYQGF